MAATDIESLAFDLASALAAEVEEYVLCDIPMTKNGPIWTDFDLSAWGDELRALVNVLTRARDHFGARLDLPPGSAEAVRQFTTMAAA